MISMYKFIIPKMFEFDLVALVVVTQLVDIYMVMESLLANFPALHGDELPSVYRHEFPGI